MSVCVGVCAYCERTLNYWFHEHPIFWIMRKILKNWYGDAENEQESTEDPDVHNRALVDAFEALHK